MLYETFKANKESLGEDFFTSRLDSEVVRSLNPDFKLREYQKEALGQFDFYFTEYQKRARPAHLLFHMATGSGKTLIMAGNILQLYKQGYRNFIFFTRLGNIIEKTKDNFLNPLSPKYQFASKITIGNKSVAIKAVDNFASTNSDDINIMFTTASFLHTRLNNPRENSITYEELENKKIVLLADEAHNLNAETKQSLSEKEKEEKRSWEGTANKILALSPENIILEFTATIGWEGDPNIRKKYEDKMIFDYSLKQFRIDKYSKEIEVMPADVDPIERVLQAIILSQYRRKVAEKHKLYLKPVVLLKSKTIKESKDNYDEFLAKMKKLSARDIERIESRTSKTALERAFAYFRKEGITFDNLIRELQAEFDEERVMLLDSENVDEEKQLQLNSLEGRDNETRAIFAVNMLNEGWDVLNLFDIVRLYDTRDGKWVRGQYQPGKTTVGEAQLIGRGARYYPFQLESTDNKYKRKFDEDTENELRVIEMLHYHSAHNPKYIEEIKSALTEMGIMAEKHVQKSLFVKPEFKKTDFWKSGVVFINDQVENLREDVFSLKDAKVERSFKHRLRTGKTREEAILENGAKESARENESVSKITFNLSNFGENIIRGALDKFDFYKFRSLKRYFPHIESVSDFITSDKYMGSVTIELSGPKAKLNKLDQEEKLNAALSVVAKIAEQARANTSEFRGTTLFKAKMLRDVFRDKKIKIDIDEVKNQELEDVNLGKKDWYAQNDFWGTSEEQSFIKFIDGFIEKLRETYSDIALFRNEKHFQVFDFEEGRAFEPDFIMMLKRRNHTVRIFQVFIEPKGDQSKDREGGFAGSKEGWKQDFLAEIEKKADTDLKLEDKQFKLVGLPFYNAKLEKEFKEVIEEKLLVSA